MNTARFPLIRRLLLLDAGTCLAMGAALIFANAPVADLTGFSPALLLGAGLVLLPCAAFMLVLASRMSPPTGGVRLVVACNVLWALASVLLPLWPEVNPNTAGLLGLWAQAAGVAVLAALEHFALGRSSPLASAA
jgi:Na+/melibiose symporter-like transporter